MSLFMPLAVHHAAACAERQGLDAALRGGLPPGVITELVGPAGVGKSQTCYTIALQVSH
jgi:RecA/RadA recombinase